MKIRRALPSRSPTTSWEISWLPSSRSDPTNCSSSTTTARTSSAANTSPCPITSLPFSERPGPGLPTGSWHGLMFLLFLLGGGGRGFHRLGLRLGQRLAQGQDQEHQRRNQDQDADELRGAEHARDHELPLHVAPVVFQEKAEQRVERKIGQRGQCPAPAAGESQVAQAGDDEHA